MKRKLHSPRISSGTLLLWLCALLCCALLSACSNNKDHSDKKAENPPGYDLSKPFQIKLPIELDEISGVVYYPEDSSILAVQDEYGYVYKIYPNQPEKIQKWKFSEGDDFEDLVLLDSTFYVLVSNGNLIEFKFITSDSLYLNNYTFPFGEGNEFEILYFDPHYQKLVMICKDCEYDKKKRLSTFTFDPQTHQYSEHGFSIEVSKIADLLGEKKLKFKPSAATINPLTKELFLISSVNKLLVIADDLGNAKEVYRINKGLFKQPEGLTFSTDGTMFVSNESAGTGVADILIFPYHKQAAYKK